MLIKKNCVFLQVLEIYLSCCEIRKLLFLLYIIYTIHSNESFQIFTYKNQLITKEPKLSVIIPVFNGGDYLKRSLKSVQNQKFNDIEIILIDDNSSDDSLKIIRNFMKKDKRIKIIENKENRRILFSKSFAALNSKGKYIIEIDQDDVFIGNDVFGILYNESEKYDLDILHFNHTFGENINDQPKLDNFIENEKIDIQPEIKFKQFKTNIYLLWGNLIKGDLYKKVIYNLWPIIINYKIIFQEDFLITFFILIYARKFKSIKNIFYYYFVSIKQISCGHQNNPEFFLSVIFAGIVFYDYYIDSHPQDFQIIINYIDWFKGHLKVIKNLYPTLFNYFFGKILTNNQLLEINKNDIMKEFNISENCDSYPYLSRNQSFFIFNELPNKNTIFHKQKNLLIELSIIIIYSSYEKIIKIINKISLQNFDSLEIIIIYDDENKTDYDLLNNYIKSFYYIKLIDNQIKRGMLYSISKGVMLAKGNYLIIFNPNYFFTNKNALQNIFNEIRKSEADIFELNIYKILSNNYTVLYKCKHFKSRFNLTRIKYNMDFNNIDIKDELLDNKIIKRKYLKYIIKTFKIEEVNDIVDYYHNKIFEFLFSSNKYKFKSISSESIYIYDFDLYKPKFNDFTTGEDKTINELHFYINFIYDNSKNDFENKQKILKEFFNVLNIIYNKFTKISNTSLELINKFINSEYYSKANKTLLQFYYNSLIN